MAAPPASTRVTLAALLAALAAALTLVPGPQPLDAQASSPGIIRGRLHLPRVPRTALPRPDVHAHGATPAPPIDAAALRRGVVYLETAPRAAFDEREPGRAVMDQRHETFVPHVLAVMVGTVVDFPNSDRIFHNVFSLSRARRFDLGRYAAGRSKAVRFDRPGVVRVFCDIHAHMNAFILVFTHPYFAVTDADGRFRLPGVPPGSYTVVGWYDGENRASAVATVTAGATVDLELDAR